MIERFSRCSGCMESEESVGSFIHRKEWKLHTLRRKYGAAWRISLNGARTWIFMMISKVSSGHVCSILSNVNPALFTMWLILPHFLENVEYELLDVQGGDSLDSGIHDDLWEIIRTNVTGNRENFSALSFYLSFYCFETLSIDATDRTRVVQHLGNGE